MDRRRRVAVLMRLLTAGAAVVLLIAGCRSAEEPGAQNGSVEAQQPPPDAGPSATEDAGGSAEYDQLMATLADPRPVIVVEPHFFVLPDMDPGPVSDQDLERRWVGDAIAKEFRYVLSMGRSAICLPPSRTVAALGRVKPEGMEVPDATDVVEEAGAIGGVYGAAFLGERQFELRLTLGRAIGYAAAPGRTIPHEKTFTGSREDAGEVIADAAQWVYEQLDLTWDPPAGSTQLCASVEDMRRVHDAFAIGDETFANYGSIHLAAMKSEEEDDGATEGEGPRVALGPAIDRALNERTQAMIDELKQCSFWPEGGETDEAEMEQAAVLAETWRYGIALRPAFVRTIASRYMAPVESAGGWVYMVTPSIMPEIVDRLDPDYPYLEGLQKASDKRQSPIPAEALERLVDDREEPSPWVHGLAAAGLSSLHDLAPTEGEDPDWHGPWYSTSPEALQHIAKALEVNPYAPDYSFTPPGLFVQQGDPYWLLSYATRPLVTPDGETLMTAAQIRKLWERLLEINPDSMFCHATRLFVLTMQAAEGLKGETKRDALRQGIASGERALELARTEDAKTFLTGRIESLEGKLAAEEQ
ncbi:MAG: hypothetical protein GF393_04645 [Armatimonadia bacterium]|nr:hypothetical protein [Armatimonadia bacterium]